MSRKAADPPSSGLFSIASLLVVSTALILVTIALLSGADFGLLLRELLLDGSICVLWLAAAVGIGWAILKIARFDCDLALRAILSASIGLGVIGLVVLGLGLFGWLNLWTAWVIVLLGVVKLIDALWKSGRQRWKFLQHSAGIHWIALLAIPAIGMMLGCATLPTGILWQDEPAAYDVTEYHLQVPREWYQAGRIMPLQHNVYSYFPFNVEMHYLLAMNLRGGPWHGMYLAQLMHAAFVLLSAAAIYALFANKYPRGAIAAATLAMVIPWMPLLGSIAYDEGGLLLFGTLAIGLAIRALDEPQPVKWMAMAGAMAGFACGSKLTAGPEILLPLPIVLLIARGPGCALRKGAVAFWISGIVVFSPWMIRNAIWTHNPLFPEATSVFGKAHWSEVQVQRWIKANHQPRLDQQNLRGRMQAAWDQVVGEARYGYLLIPFALLAAVVRRDREVLTLLLLLIFQAIFWLFFTHLQGRFFILSIPICALLVAGLKSKEWLIASAAVTMVVTCFGTYFVWQKLQAIQTRANASMFQFAGIEQPMPLPTLPADIGNKQVELIGDAQAFLCDVPMSRLYYRTVFDVDARPGESAIDAWRRGWPRGDNVITVINPQELMRFHRTYWEIPEP